MLIIAFSFLACAPKHDTTDYEVSVDTRREPVVEVEADEPDPVLARDVDVDADVDRDAGDNMPPQASAIAKLAPTTPDGIGGAVAFTQSEKDVKVSINLTGASPGVHVVRLHQGGGCSFTQPAAGADIDDLATIDVNADGIGHTDITVDSYKLAEGEDALLGQAVVVDDGKACGIISMGN